MSVFVDQLDRISTTLSGSYTAGGSSLSLSSATGLPSGACFFFLIVQAEGSNTEEVFLVTNVSGTTATVTGAQANTSASNHASGAVVIASILAANAMYGLTPDLLSFEHRPYGTPTSFKTEVTAFNHGASVDLVNYSGGPGYMSDFWFSVTLNYSDLNNITMTITADGNTVFSDRACLYFAAEYQYNTTVFASRFIGASNNNSNNVGYYNFLPVPFSSSLKITITNNSGSQNGFCWSTLTLQLGVPNRSPRTRRMICSSGLLTNQTVDTVITLVNATGLNPGRLAGISMSLDSYPNGANPPTAPLEGNFKFYLDGSGSPSIETSGTEDYPHMANYFQGYNAPTVPDYLGLTFKTSETWNFYRFHIPDPICFQNALKVTWNCGDSGEVNFTGGVRVAFCLWYYTE
jgi:hypothetical protein